jgi:hypothetical protein
LSLILFRIAIVSFIVAYFQFMHTGGGLHAPSSLGTPLVFRKHFPSQKVFRDHKRYGIAGLNNPYLKIINYIYIYIYIYIGY